MDEPLTVEERQELLALIASEWDKHPEWTFQRLMGEMNYIAVGHTDIMESNERSLLKAFRGGWRNL